MKDGAVGAIELLLVAAVGPTTPLLITVPSVHQVVEWMPVGEGPGVEFEVLIGPTVAPDGCMVVSTVFVREIVMTDDTVCVPKLGELLVLPELNGVGVM